MGSSHETGGILHAEEMNRYHTRLNDLVQFVQSIACDKKLPEMWREIMVNASNTHHSVTSTRSHPSAVKGNGCNALMWVKYDENVAA